MQGPVPQRGRPGGQAHRQHVTLRLRKFPQAAAIMPSVMVGPTSQIGRKLSARTWKQHVIPANRRVLARSRGPPGTRSTPAPATPSPSACRPGPPPGTCGSASPATPAGARPSCPSSRSSPARETPLLPGSTAASVTSITTSGTFSQSNSCGSSIGAGSSCTVSVKFAPTSSGAASGTLTVTSSAPGSPLAVALSVPDLPLALTPGPPVHQTTAAPTHMRAQQRVPMSVAWLASPPSAT